MADNADAWPMNALPGIVIPQNGHEQRERQRQRRKDRKRQRMAPSMVTVAASNVIELLDDDEDDFVDLSTNTATIQGKVSPIRDGEIQVLEVPQDAGPKDQRKPPPLAGNNTVIGSPLLRVLEIFPDADVEYVKNKLREQNNNIEIVVAVLSGSSGYPKQKKGSLGDANSNGNSNGSTTIIRGIQNIEPKHDYSSSSASFEISEQYRSEVVSLLMHDFCLLTKSGIRSLLKQNNGRYTLTRNHIHDMIVGKNLKGPPTAAAAAGSEAAARLEQEENENYHLLRSILIRGSCPKSVRKRIDKSYLMMKPRKKIGVSRPPITDPVLEDEYYFFEKRFQEWLSRVKDRMRKQAANKLAVENGVAVQCVCCFDDVAITECIQCKDMGHLFCKDCIIQYVESQVFGSGNLGIDKHTKKPALELKCCEGSGCNSGFPDDMLRKTLPQKTWQKYSEMQIKAQLEQAGLGGDLAMCPKCGYQAEVPNGQMIFDCPIAGCQFSSCIKCGKASHIPLRCEEVVKEKSKNEGRLKIEEALSEAKMRTCPKCHKRFIKLDGCNKMTCACGMKMCYVCRMPLDKIKGNVYSHFCQEPHCDHKSCGKCRLYTNNDEDDAMAMREAGIKAKEDFEAKMQNENGKATFTAEDLQLDVDEIMYDPSRPRQPAAKKRQRNHGQHINQGANQHRHRRPRR